MKLAKLVTVAGVVSCAGCCLTSALGQSFSEDFSGGNDSAFTHYDPIGTALSNPGMGGSWLVGGGEYQIWASPSPLPSVLGPGRAGSVINGFSAGDYKVSYDLVAFSAEQPMFAGVATRVAEIGPGTTDGYVLGYDNSGSKGLFISKVVNEGVTAVIATTPVTLDRSTSYRFEFTLKGSSLSGKVFDRSNLATPLATIAGTDTSYTTGEAMLLTASNSSAVGTFASADFANISITPVPEPATCASLAGLGLMAFAGFRRWRTGRAASTQA